MGRRFSAGLQFGHFASPKGRKQNSPRASALGRRPRENRPERAAEGRGLFPKKTFVQEPLTRPILSAKAIFFDKEERMWT